MTLITPDADNDRTIALLEDMQATLEGFRKELDAYKEEARAGGKPLKTTEAKATVGNIGSLLASCMKLETNLAECRQRQSEIARGGYAFNFDEARSEVRCALDKLRSCRGSGPVSE